MTTCWNYKNAKSRERCPRRALAGHEYCGYHSKNPKRYTVTSNTLPTENPTVRLQRWWRHQQYRTHGPAFYTLSLANNTEDFCTFDTKEEIPRQYFYSYLDVDSFVYCFDMRSLFHLVTTTAKPLNPYNRSPIPKHILKHLILLQQRYEKMHVSIEQEKAQLTPEQIFNARVVDVFQEIDKLDNYTNPDWFLTMDLNGLKTYYSVLHSLFMFRLGLSDEQKMSIVAVDPENFPFSVTPESIRRKKNYGELRKFVIDTIYAMISTAESRELQKLGAMYVLMAFVAVNNNAAQAYPYLVM